jgi:hypothetical protein
MFSIVGVFRQKGSGKRNGGKSLSNRIINVILSKNLKSFIL